VRPSARLHLLLVYTRPVTHALVILVFLLFVGAGVIRGALFAQTILRSIRGYGWLRTYCTQFAPCQFHTHGGLILSATYYSPTPHLCQPVPATIIPYDAVLCGSRVHPFNPATRAIPVAVFSASCLRVFTQFHSAPLSGTLAGGYTL
jgi:short subunit fatty acids transporter